MIPKKVVDQLMQYYKGELTDNAFLNKAARLAVNKHNLLSDTNKPASIINAKTKPISGELAKLSKQLRTFPFAGVGGAAPTVEEEENDESGMVTGPLQQWLKKIIKGSPHTPKTQMSVTIPKKGTLSTSKSTSATTRFGKKSNSSTTTTSTSRARQYKERLAELCQALEKGKQKPKTEVERLKPLPGWEDWAKGKKTTTKTRLR